jgi:hypothetical protein
LTGPQQVRRDLPGNIDAEARESAGGRVTKAEQVGALIDSDDKPAARPDPRERAVVRARGPGRRLAVTPHVDGSGGVGGAEAGAGTMWPTLGGCRVVSSPGATVSTSGTAQPANTAGPGKSRTAMLSGWVPRSLA